MFRKKRNFRKIGKANNDIAPDEIFLDSSNLPKFNTSQFEGRMEKPINKRTIIATSLIFLFIGIVFSGRVWHLQISRGEELKLRSQDNNLQNIIQFSERGIIYDRNGKELAWNALAEEERDFPERKYMAKKGLSHLLGFVDYPKKDSSGRYYEYKISGQDGVEKYFEEELGGETGLQIIETNVFGETLSESVIDRADNGRDIVLSIDWRIQNKLYELIEQTAKISDFQGGAGLIMDVENGELLAIVSYPEYDSQVLTNKKDTEKISAYTSDPKKPFLNRAVSGLYTPGSIIKPFIALAALEEEIISPQKSILSTGSISIQNPYNPEQKSVFRDWKAHGFVDMRKALAVSSNVYFYAIGGGYEDQEGLGITRIEKYLKNFGFGKITGIDVGEENDGVVPNPRWKKEVFNDDWRLGDTYITSIGQFGFQLTPLQVLRGAAMIANKGKLLKPTVLAGEMPIVEKEIKIDDGKFEIVREGMREAVLSGTAGSLNFPYIRIAAKTGTAELGVLKESVNSWILGFWPYEKPRYAFAVVMERRESKNPIGGLFVATNLIDWMRQNTPEYLEEAEK